MIGSNRFFLQHNFYWRLTNEVGVKYWYKLRSNYRVRSRQIWVRLGWGRNRIYLFGDTDTGSSIFSCLIDDAVMSTTSSVAPEVRGALIGWTVVWFWLVDSGSAVFISTTVDDWETPAADWSSLWVSLCDPVVDISLAWRNNCWCCS